MMDLLVYSRLQLGCFVFLAYIGFLMILSAGKERDCNVFSDLLYILGMVCVVFDALTAWSVNRPDVVSRSTNIILHGIFYILLESELWLMYFYFRSIVNRLPNSIGQLVFFVVLVLASFAVTLINLPNIEFVSGNTTNYSYGIPVFVIFSLVPLFLIFIFIFGRKALVDSDPIKKLTFTLCFLTVCIFSLIQFIFPESLVTSLNVSIIVISVALNSENPLFHKMEKFRKKYEMEKKYYDRLDEIEQRQAIIRHDEKHYLAAIGGLCAEGKTEEIEKLLKVMNIELQKNTPKKYVRNRITNALFNEKESIALRQNIRLDFQVEPEVDLDEFADVDLIAMFGNIIDNAVRAEAEWMACNHDGKCDNSVGIKLFETDGNFIMLVVENHFARLETRNGKIVTTKNEPEQHGLGLINIKRICEKYGGVFDMEMEDNIFTVSVCLPKMSRGERNV